MSKRTLVSVLFALMLLVSALGPSGPSAHADDSRTFPETGKTVSGRFLDYWNTHGGLAQQGYPISEEMQEQSSTDGKTYTMQYFERAVFEAHPENRAPYDVLLSLLGNFYYQGKYKGNAPGQKPSTANPRRFAETGKTLGGAFRQYWEQHGGLAQQGYPISDEFQEQSATDGKTYTVQYFERAVFEAHPENQAPNDVLLSLLGVFTYNAKHGTGGGGGSGGNNPTPTPAPAPAPATVQNTLSIPGWTHMVVTTNNIAIFYNADKGGAAFARVNPDGSLTVLQKYLYPATTPGGPDFSPGITIITPGPANQVLFYRADAGAASVCRMSDDGVLVGGCSNFGFEKYWTTIAIDRQTGAAYIYSSTAGVRNIARLNADGSIATFSSGTNYIKEQRLVVPIGNSMWLIYDPKTKEGTTFSINKDTGEFKRLQTVPDLGAPWSHIASNQSTVGFYSASAQASLMGSTALDGSIVKLKNYYAPSGITIVTAAYGGPYLNYWGSTGEITVVKVAGDGTATNLQDYKAEK